MSLGVYTLQLGSPLPRVLSSVWRVTLAPNTTVMEHRGHSLTCVAFLPLTCHVLGPQIYHSSSEYIANSQLSST